MQAYHVINLLCRGVLKRTRNISDLVSVDICMCIDTDFFWVDRVRNMCLFHHRVSIILWCFGYLNFSNIFIFESRKKVWVQVSEDC